MIGCIPQENESTIETPLVLPDDIDTIKLPERPSDNNIETTILQDMWSKHFFARKLQKHLGLSVSPNNMGHCNRSDTQGIHHCFIARPDYAGKTINDLMQFESRTAHLLQKLEALWQRGLAQQADQKKQSDIGTHVMRRELTEYDRPLKLLVKPPRSMLQKTAHGNWISPMNTALRKRITRTLKSALRRADAQNMMTYMNTKIKSGYYLSSQGLIQVFDVSIHLLDAVVLNGRLRALCRFCEQAVRDEVLKYLNARNFFYVPVVVIVRPAKSWLRFLKNGRAKREKQRLNQLLAAKQRQKFNDRWEDFKKRFLNLSTQESFSHENNVHSMAKIDMPSKKQTEPPGDNKT